MPPMMTSNLINIFTQVFKDLLSYLDIDHKFMCEIPVSSMKSDEPVNVLIGIMGDMNGNIMLGYSDKTAKEIAAKLIGINEIKEMDFYSQAALADFCAEFGKRFANSLKKEQALLASQESLNATAKNKTQDCDLLVSFPIYIAGSEMDAIISQTPSKKLFFKINGEQFNLTYSFE